MPQDHDERDRDDRDEHGEPRPRTRSGNRKWWLIIIVVADLVVIGGGLAVWYFAVRETNADVVAQYREAFAEQRGKLKKVSALLPPAGTVQKDDLPAGLDPKPLYDVPNKAFNTAFLMAAHLDDPDRDLTRPDEIDLAFHEDEFRTHLRWTGDKNPMAAAARQNRPGDLAARFERSLGLKYLVVLRPVRFVPPQVLDGKTFVGGELDLEVFLIDYPAEKVVGRFRRSFTPVNQVRVEAKTERELADRAEAVVRSEAWSKARAEVAGTLARGTGGTFVTDR